MNVELFCENKIPNESRLLKFARAVCKAEKKLNVPGKICIIFVSAKKLRRMNVEFLGHDYNTDVITFPYDAPPDASFSAPPRKSAAPLRKPGTPFGDVYISVEMARRQAKLGGHSLQQELALMVVHGLLHLAGYDDHKHSDKKKMFLRQEALFKQCAPDLPPVVLPFL